MFEGLFSYGIPIVIAVIFIYFVWAWILMAVKPPKETNEEWAGVKLYPRWNAHLDRPPLTPGDSKTGCAGSPLEQKRKAA
ncbi:MAG: hypothetical protein MPW15_25945 [Candidatus Manganitrophus sp.]|nr:hypothetical protein [Candidatus Manganitrophus sp.]